MHTKTKLAIVGAALAATLAVGGVAIAGLGDDDDDSPPITGPELDKASAAALEHTGEGRVTETEVGDEDSYYEVEVTLEDGTQVDVQLDRDFTVVGSENDGLDDEGDEDDEDGD